MFPPLFVEDFQYDQYFSDGLTPSTSSTLGFQNTLLLEVFGPKKKTTPADDQT